MINPEDILATYLKGATSLPEQRAMYLTLCQAIPTVLADLLDKPFTVVNFAKAKLAMAQYAVRPEFALKYAEVLGYFYGGEPLDVTLAETMGGWEDTINDFPAFCRKYGTEDKKFLLEMPFISDAVLTLRAAGILTIGDVVVNEPQFFLDLH